MAGKHGSAQDRADARALLEIRPGLGDLDRVIRRLERWRLELGLGPLEDASQEERTAHYLALADLLGRGKSASWMALVMAGYGFPSEAYRVPLVKFWGVFEVDEASSHLPPFGDADTRPDAERYSDVEELAGKAVTEVFLEGRSITDEDEGLGDAERAFAPFVQQVLGNLPLGDLSLVLEDATERVVGFHPSDPVYAPMPELAAKIVPEESRPSDETMSEAEALLTHRTPIVPEIARAAQEEPLENLAQAAAFAYELVRSFGLAAGDEEKARAQGALLAPGFLAFLNVLGPVAAEFLRKRGLLTTVPESTTKNSPM